MGETHTGSKKLRNHSLADWDDFHHFWEDCNLPILADAPESIEELSGEDLWRERRDWKEESIYGKDIGIC